MANANKLETSSSVSNVTPTSGWIASWYEDDNGTIKQKCKLSSGTIVDVTGTPKTYVNLSAATWSAGTTYSDYPYECNLTVSGVTDTSDAEVIFGVTEAVSGNYAPVCQTGAGVITIYSKVNTSITVAKVRVY